MTSVVQRFVLDGLYVHGLLLHCYYCCYHLCHCSFSGVVMMMAITFMRKMVVVRLMVMATITTKVVFHRKRFCTDNIGGLDV